HRGAERAQVGASREAAGRADAARAVPVPARRRRAVGRGTGQGGSDAREAADAESPEPAAATGAVWPLPPSGQTEALSPPDVRVPIGTRNRGRLGGNSKTGEAIRSLMLTWERSSRSRGIGPKTVRA